MKSLITLFAIAVALSFTSSGYAGDNKVPYPEDYRNWTHVKSMIIEAGHPLANPFQGIHHVYANKQALAGLNQGKYADGAVLVFDLLKVEEKDNTIQESGRKLVGVMHRDARKYSTTGGWGFEGFAASSKSERLTSDGGASCFGCHAPVAESDYVFSQYRK